LVIDRVGLKKNSDIFQKNYKLIWQNPRKTGGYRLTTDGYNFFVNHLELKSYNIEFPEDLIITNQALLQLDRYVNSPYWIGPDSIVVFTERLAIQLILCGGDIRKFGSAKAKNTRLRQNDKN